ncbi:MAG: ABC transporter substrate-binding protein [Methanomassiliicoccaceae archaeon]|nr:ABC transporter substrate-binding protein [Methanomassiliicoccaceae archaeon]
MNQLTAIIAAVLVMSVGVGVYLVTDNTNGGLEDEEGVTVIDDRGVSVIFTEPPKRVMSLGSSFTDTLLMLGSEDRIAAVDQSSVNRLQDDRLSSKYVLSSINPANNLEFALEKNIDCVIVWNWATYAPGIAMLESAGINVLALNPVNIETVMDTVNILGKAMGKDDVAAGLVEFMNDTIENIRTLATEKDGYGEKRIYIELDTATRASPGTGSITGSMLDILGIQNANRHMNTTPLDNEDIISFVPEMAIFMGPRADTFNDEARYAALEANGIPIIKYSAETGGFNGNWASATPSFINGLIWLYELIYGVSYEP